MARTHLIAEQVRRIESDPALTAHLTADSDATAAFGKAFGGVSVVLGALGFGGASLMFVDPASVLGPVAAMFTLIIFHFVLGLKVYRLSRHPAGNLEDRDRGCAR
jgi:hypothetical protein